MPSNNSSATPAFVPLQRSNKLNDALQRLKGSGVLEFINCLFKSLWLFFPAIITIAAAFALFVSDGAGADVVIQVSEYSGPAFMSLLGVFFWAYIIWYSSRLVAYRKAEQIPADSMMDRFLQNFPRLLSFLAFASIQVAVLCLPEVKRIIHLGKSLTPWAVVFFLALQILLHFLIRNSTQKLEETATVAEIKLRVRDVFGSAGVMTIIGLNVAFWLVVIFQSGFQVTHVWKLSCIAVGLFVIQLLSVYFLINRRIRKAQEPADLRLQFLFFFATIKCVTVYEKTAFKVFSIIVSVGTALYFTCIISIWFADLCGPLGSMMFSFGILAGLLNLISFASMTLKINLFPVIVIVSAIVGKCYDPYTIRTINDPGSHYASRANAVDYFDAWIAQRRDLIERTPGKFEVYLTLADGGASRSGYWAASVLGALEDAGPDSIGGRFSDHLFCMSGTSGGTVGNAAFFAMLGDHNNKNNYTKRAQEFLKTDFLSFGMAHFLGPDLWGHFGIFPDRAAAIEQVMDKAGDSLGISGFSKPLNQYFDSSGKLPVLFINSTEVQHGRPAIISNINIESFSQRYDILSKLEKNKNLKDRNIRISTASILSARFPYISPAGRLDSLYFVDGGYFDNSGAGIVQEMMEQIDSAMQARKDSPQFNLYQKLSFRLVHISNNPVSRKAEKRMSPLSNNLAAPLITVLNTYSSQTDVNDSRLKRYFKQDRRGIHIVNDDINLYAPGDTTTSFPMNWVISNYHLKKMNNNLRRIIDSFADKKVFGVTKRAKDVRMILQE